MDEAVASLMKSDLAAESRPGRMPGGFSFIQTPHPWAPAKLETSQEKTTRMMHDLTSSHTRKLLKNLQGLPRKHKKARLEAHPGKEMDCILKDSKRYGTARAWRFQRCSFTYNPGGVEGIRAAQRETGAESHGSL